MSTFQRQYKYTCPECRWQALADKKGLNVTCAECGDNMVCKRSNDNSIDRPFTHRFLFGSPRSTADKHPAEYVGDIKEKLADMPKAKTTFYLTDLFDVGRAAIPVTDVALNFCGTWSVPEWLAMGSSEKFVNPYAAHAGSYQEVGYECACGSLIGNLEPSHPYTGEHFHENECPCRDATYIDEIRRQRKEIIRQGLLLGLTYNKIGPRLGLTGKSARRWGNRNDIDAQQLKQQFHYIRKRTIDLLIREVDARTIGRAYGISANRVRDILRQNTNEVGIRPKEDPTLVI